MSANVALEVSSVNFAFRPGQKEQRINRLKCVHCDSVDVSKAYVRGRGWVLFSTRRER